MPEKFEDHRKNQPEEKTEESLAPENEKRDISGEEFLGVFTSENFLKALKIAGQETAKSGYETAFDVDILRDGKSYISHVFKGNVDGLKYSQDRIEINGETKEWKKRGELLSFHFHPVAPSEERISPSRDDLTILHYNNFIGIGQIGKYIEILLVRKKVFISESEINENAQAYGEEISKRGFIARQKEVQEILENNGFESFYIVFNKKKNKYELSEESKKKILKIKGIKVEMVSHG